MHWLFDPTWLHWQSISSLASGHCSRPSHRCRPYMQEPSSHLNFKHIQMCKRFSFKLSNCNYDWSCIKTSTWILDNLPCYTLGMASLCDCTCVGQEITGMMTKLLRKVKPRFAWQQNLLVEVKAFVHNEKPFEESQSETIPAAMTNLLRKDKLTHHRECRSPLLFQWYTAKAKKCQHTSL